MARKLKSDKLLFTATLVLVCASLVMVYSASAVIGLEQYQQRPTFFLFKQATFALLGLALMPVLMRIDYRHYRQPVVIWTALAMVAFGLVAVLFGPRINGARRWFGGAGIGVQPAEFAKIVVVVFVAAILERRMDRIDDLRYSLVPVAIVLGVVVALIMLQPDLGTALSIVVIVGAMIFAAGINYRYIFGLLLVSLPAAYIVLMSADYRRRRMTVFLNPWEDPLGDGFQVIQSLIAVGTGGLFGRGLMAGVQKLFYLPYPHTDFIYAVIGEELGLAGCTIVLACFCVIAWRGLRTAMRAPDRFGAFLALGVTAMVVVQAFFNISVVLGLLPTKGIPLPFVSYGGSSLLVSMVGMGILLNVSQHASTSHVVTTVLEPSLADA
ncbi:MAG TPA: putative lipid II flippase FtsW [Vicinamibacterales bacterium]|jgi:cell division protein FtsW|nr:putative lipid II flippase FtsW [Vicinamibacterales bacterium]